MVSIFGCPGPSNAKDPLYMAVFELLCNVMKSLDRATLEGASLVALFAASRP